MVFSLPWKVRKTPGHFEASTARLMMAVMAVLLVLVVFLLLLLTLLF
jgi:hypothetical protein